MKGYVANKGDRWYAVIYEGLDPVTGKELRSWHSAGTSREEAERLAARLAKELNGRNDEGRSLTFGAYLTTRWLPGKKIELARSTWDGYRRKIDRHILPTLGTVSIRRLRPHHLEALYDRKLHPTDGRKPLAPKTVLEIHLIIRGALNDAVRRGIVTRNVAYVAHAPKLRAIPKVEQQAWTAQQLQGFLREAAGHRLFPALWLIATTGLRRSELLGLQWKDVDLEKATLSINRGLVSVGYDVHESRGKTSNSRRAIDLDATTVQVLSAWCDWQRTEQAVVGIKPTRWVFTTATGKPIHPHSISQTFERIVKRSGVPRIRLHDLRHTHGTLLIKAGIPVKVVSERLGHGNPAFTIDTYQHVLPGMQAEAARMFESLITPEASTG
ncbi:MAG: tyrosine-type recombinase/integrase [Actinomycetota bacterium]|nr:tyrosine-type recombinase/integrase [Actinomycetota bacterium]